MPALVLRCSESSCPFGGTFVWSQREQVFYKSKGFRPPVRCPGCRSRRKGGKLLYRAWCEAGDHEVWVPFEPFAPFCCREHRIVTSRDAAILGGDDAYIYGRMVRKGWVIPELHETYVYNFLEQKHVLDIARF